MGKTGKNVTWIIVLSIFTILSIFGVVLAGIFLYGYISEYIKIIKETNENNLGSAIGEIFTAIFLIITLIIATPVTFISLLLSCIPKSLIRAIKATFIIVNASCLTLDVLMFITLIVFPKIVQ